VAGPSSSSTPPPRAAPASSTPSATGSANAAVTPLPNGSATPRPLATIAVRRAAPPLRLFSRDAGEIHDPAIAAPPSPPPSTPLAVNIADQVVSPTLRRTWISVPHGKSARTQASPRANGRVRALENGHASPGMNGGGGAPSSLGERAPLLPEVGSEGGKRSRRLLTWSLATEWRPALPPFSALVSRHQWGGSTADGHGEGGGRRQRASAASAGGCSCERWRQQALASAGRQRRQRRAPAATAPWPWLAELWGLGLKP
jgi:hypothetical protein